MKTEEIASLVQSAIVSGDPDALEPVLAADEWRASGVVGQFIEPSETEYGLREGAHVDSDGNLIRFGSRLP